MDLVEIVFPFKLSTDEETKRVFMAHLERLAKDFRLEILGSHQTMDGEWVATLQLKSFSKAA